MMNGFTENYVKVELPLQPELINEIREVELVNINPRGLVEGRLYVTPLSH